MEKLDLHSPDLVTENIDKIASLFPNCVTEGLNGKVIDFDLLKQELNHSVVDGTKERYRLEWPGKKEAIVTANLPTTKTLRPVREESVDFDNTENIYIEGDNLEVLKLLQESYLGKIKMIYIDPPYNTGNDFVYKDNFNRDSHQELLLSGQKDEYNNRLVVNSDTSGRYHSDWLSMMYPRIKLARNLLSNDGVIFVSIDDNEVQNLSKICDEIFGERNFVAQIIVQTNPRGRTFDRFIAKTHEYIMIYAKRIEDEGIHDIPKDENAIAGYSKEDFHGKYRLLELRNRNPVFNRANRPLLYYPIYADPKQLDVSLCKTIRHTIEIYPKNSLGEDGCWTWGSDKSKRDVHLLVANHASTGKWSVYRKDYLEGSSLYTKSKSLWLEKEMNHENGKEILGNLFGKTPFDFPKSVEYIKKCLLLATSTSKNDIVLDFFSGSGTTAHSIFDLNYEDGGNRKFILVQLPELNNLKSEDISSNYKNVCEIGKERIRRAAARIRELSIQQINENQNDLHLLTLGQQIINQENERDDILNSINEIKLKLKNLDLGFRVYRLDSSNMNDIYYKPQDYNQNNLDLFADNIKSDRTADDLLAQVMIDWGLQLSLKIEETNISGKKVFKVAGNSLYACFDNGIDESFAKVIAKNQPLRIVFRDSGFANDNAKINVKQLLKQLSPETEMKVI